ncbi:hypothetical protein DACRYDRAFT_117887 [Dacryopinax primogenitus]|uniref:F-box domain-containing protein n=1 Tax=Dacryopinax primogenitus (strain DJM 731) TaxID=1858805 RepID=M5FVT4_DACPD|nr:uncharacterized protein DACRYDRAFT_117887 [Dacryopinax primogenitus]EJT99704.1 hypothetical protein DACRYDRAFT_117887 [Dacryopinax primogenitus]
MSKSTEEGQQLGNTQSSGRSSLPVLSYDVWSDILRYAKRQDLIRLCLVSSMFNRIAAKRLYLSVRFFDVPDLYPFYRTVRGNPILAGHVAALELDMRSYKNDRMSKRHITDAPAFMRMIFHLIGQLDNLKKICFKFRILNSLVCKAFSINLGHMRPRLSSFRFYGLFECSALPVLSSQSLLETVALEYSSRSDGSPELASLPPDALPRLRRFICNSYSSAQVVRGRPVELFVVDRRSAYVNISPEQLPTCLQDLHMSTRGILLLELAIDSLYATTTLCKIQEATPDLQQLELNTSDFWVNQMRDLTSPESLDAFRKFAQLESFKIDARQADDMPFTAFEFAIRSILRARPTLRVLALWDYAQDKVYSLNTIARYAPTGEFPYRIARGRWGD